MEFTLPFLILITTFYVVYFIGNLISKGFGFSVNNDTFFNKMMLGILLLISIYALVKSNFKSVFFLALLIGVYFLYKKLSFDYNTFKVKLFSKMNFGFFFMPIVLLVFYLIQLHCFIDFNTLELKLLNDDYAFYSRLAMYLQETGNENNVFSYFIHPSGDVLPFHYADVWFVALIREFTKLHSQHILILVVYPLFYSVVYLGALDLLAILRQKNNQSLKKIDHLLSLMIITIGFWSFLYPSNIDFLAMDIWASNLIQLNKLVVVYMFGILILKGIINEEYFSVSISASLLVVCYVSIAPALFLSLGFYYIYLFSFRDLKLKDTIRLFAPLFFTAIFFLVFYSVFGAKSPTALENDSLLSQIFDLNYVRTFVNVIGKMSIQVIIISSPYLALLFFTRKNLSIEVRRLFFFLFIILGCSLFVWAFLWKMHDSVQLYSNLILPMANLSLFYFLAYILITDFGKIIKLFVFLIIGISSVTYFYTSVYEDSYLYQDQKLSEKKKILGEDKTFAFFKEDNEYKTRFDRIENVYVGQSRNLSKIYDPLQIICLSIDKIPVNNIEESKFAKSLEFSTYYDELKKDTIDLTIKEAKQKFLDDFKIDYLLISNKRELPSEYSEIYKNESITTIDNYSVYQRK